MTAVPAVAEESLRIEAPAQVLYDLVADVARMGEWSPEATGAKGAAKSPAVGDRFIGTNRHGLARWVTVCTVRQAERGSLFAFDVDVGPFPVSHWSYRFAPDPQGGTLVTETWLDRRQGLRSLPIKALGAIIIPGDRAAHNRETMRTTLLRLRAAAQA